MLRGNRVLLRWIMKTYFKIKLVSLNTYFFPLIYDILCSIYADQFPGFVWSNLIQYRDCKTCLWRDAMHAQVNFGNQRYHFDLT